MMKQSLSRGFTLTALIFISASTSVLFAQESNCGQITATAKMARARTHKVLIKLSKQAGDSYRAQFVFAYRSFQLHPGTVEAERLLKLLPKDDAQQTVLMTLNDSLCDEEAMSDMTTLARVNEAIGREIAKAVLLVRRFMPAYVAYSMIAVGDPHSDFAVQMRRVCQQSHTDFLGAVKQLPADKQQWFSNHIMKTDSCHPLALPEAE